jgi:hypothetical protein
MTFSLFPTAASSLPHSLPVSAHSGLRAIRPHLRAATARACSVFCSFAKRPARSAGGSQMSESKSLSLALSLTTGCCAATPTPYAQQPLSSKSTLIVESRLSDGGGCHAVRTSGLHSRGACASFPTGCVTPAAGQCWLSTYGLSACVSRTLHGRRGASTDRKVNSHSHWCGLHQTLSGGYRDVAICVHTGSMRSGGALSK